MDPPNVVHQKGTNILGCRYVSTMDFHTKLGLLVCTGLETPGNSPTFLAAFAASEPNGFVPRGFIQRPPTSQVSCIRVSGTGGGTGGRYCWVL